MSPPLPTEYRPCAGVMLLNDAGEVFVGQRIDTTLEAWQMPQGGIDPGEDALSAAIRELGEEAGIAPAHVALVAEAPETLLYDLPVELIGKLWGGRWRGQAQRWFLFRFLGTDADINIETEHPEFRAWCWMAPDQLPHVIVPFKRDLYARLLDLFADHLGAAAR